MRSSSGVALGLGTGPLGGLFDHVSAHEAEDTLEAAWRLGVRFFDTAPLYGSGLAEERLGRALARRPREEYTISTKVGRVLQPGPAPRSSAARRRSSRLRLQRRRHPTLPGREPRAAGLDAVDLALLPDPEKHMEEPRRAVETTRDLAPRVGVDTNVVQTGITFVERGNADVVLLAGRLTSSTARRPTSYCRSARSAAWSSSRPACSTAGSSPAARCSTIAGYAWRSRATEEARRGLRPPRGPSRRCRDSVPTPICGSDLDPRRRPDVKGDLGGHPSSRSPRSRRAVVGAPSIT